MLYSIKKISELDKTLKRYCKKCVVKVAERKKSVPLQPLSRGRAAEDDRLSKV